MGNSCKKCEVATTSSVINLSDDCVGRLEGDVGPITTKQLRRLMNAKEADWMDKLQCIDEAHSEFYGLTRDQFNRLVDRVEKQLAMEDAVPCARDNLIDCLDRNNHCLVKCRKQMDDFIDCIDLGRINKMKEQIEQERKQSRKDEITNLLKESEAAN